MYRTEINVVGLAETYPGRLGSESSGNSSVHGSNGETLIFEEKVRNLRDIVTGGKYPCVVKVKSGNVEAYAEKAGVDIPYGTRREGVTLDLIELRRHKMVVTTKLQWERRTGEYSKTEKVYDVNVAQKGWFEVLPESGQPVEYFDTISAIVALRPKQFLVRTSTVGYELSIENGVSSWVPHEIRPGETLTTGIIHMDQKKSKKKTLFKRLFSSTSGKGKKDQDLKYLQCFDCNNCEIMVPLIMTGVFSPVGDPSNPNVDAVYSLVDLISAFNLPIKAQLVHSDSKTPTGVPTGVVLLEHLKDNETVLFAPHPYVEGESDTFEIPLTEDILVVKEKKKRVKKSPLLIAAEEDYDNTVTNVVEPVIENGHVDLPIRVKETKKSKGSTILEKLSVRSKSRKERASLKALQEQGIFSSRLSKSDLNFEDFYGLDNDENSDENKDDAISPVNNSHNVPVDGRGVKSKTELDLENGYVTTKRPTMQDRDLPPIPNKTRSPARRGPYDKENDYEELPVAPRPPKFYQGDPEDHHDDGYMTPARFKELNGESEGRGTGDYDNIVRRKPPTLPKDYARLKYARARKARSEYSSGPSRSVDEYVDNNIDKYFDYALGAKSESPYTRRQPSNYAHPIPPPASHEEDRRFHDDTAIESRSLTGFAKLKSRSHKNLAVETNATIRSHNVRKMRNAADVFNFSDSLRDVRQPVTNGNVEITQEPVYGRVVDNERVKSYVYGQQSSYGRLGTPGYVESEPGFQRKYQRSSSIAALSDSFPKHGDDSAISMCSRGSRGEYGTLHGESEYSYSEYSEWHDDGWVPPDDISNLSVLEVSKSLRFIGMKDRVVIRFAREQIDGNMLQTLDIKLLKEGFPELNGLDIKKILDFVNGWRPKK